MSTALVRDIYNRFEMKNESINLILYLNYHLNYAHAADKMEFINVLAN